MWQLSLNEKTPESIAILGALLLPELLECDIDEGCSVKPKNICDVQYYMLWAWTERVLFCVTRVIGVSIQPKTTETAFTDKVRNLNPKLQIFIVYRCMYQWSLHIFRA